MWYKLCFKFLGWVVWWRSPVQHNWVTEISIIGFSLSYTRYKARWTPKILSSYGWSVQSKTLITKLHSYLGCWSSSRTFMKFARIQSSIGEDPDFQTRTFVSFSISLQGIRNDKSELKLFIKITISLHFFHINWLKPGTKKKHYPNL